MTTTLDDLLAQLRSQFILDSETEHELIDEIRAHLEDALAQANESGEDPDQALNVVLARFGLDVTGLQLQEVHAGWGTADAVVAAGLPVLSALVLRWLVFAPDGTAIGWDQILARPAFWVVAVAALFIPLLKLGRWRYGLASWAFFWLITVVFCVFPAAHW